MVLLLRYAATRRMMFTTTFGILMLCALASCSSSKTLNNETAAKRVKDYLGWHLSAIHVDIGRVGKDCVSNYDDATSVDLTPQSSVETLVAEAAGYVAVTQDGPGFWKVALTEAGKANVDGTPSPQPPKKGCDYQTAAFVIANRELISVEGITSAETNPEVSYLWRWHFTNLGRELRADGKAYGALTPSQRLDLATHQTFGVDKLPKLSIPVPPDNYSSVATMRFTKLTDGWRIEQ
jgi:hypothetical protein